MKSVIRSIVIWGVVLILFWSCDTGTKQEHSQVAALQKNNKQVVHHKGVLDLLPINSHQVISIGRDSLLIAWDIDSGKSINFKRLPKQPVRLATTAEKKALWVVCENGVIYRLNLKNLSIRETIPTVLKDIRGLTFSKPMNLFFGNGDRELFRFNPLVSNIELLSTSTGTRSSVGAHGLQPLLAIFTGDKVRIIDARTFKAITSIRLPGFRAQKKNQRFFKFAGINSFIAAYGENIWIGDWKTRKVKKQLKTHLAPITSLTVSYDGKLAATGSMDKSIKIWEIPSGNLKASLYGHFFTVNALAFTDSARILISASEDAGLLVWDLLQRTQRLRLGSLEIASKNPWRLNLERVTLARSFKVGSEEYNVSDPKTKLLKVKAKIENIGESDAMFFSSNLFLIAPDKTQLRCVGLENYVALGPKAYFKRRLSPGESLKGNFIFIITPPYQNYSFTYETLKPIPLKQY
ncbi:MAG: DUF4352 domain-containing protein [Calditrichaeota bacterium]|nr:DUF4352 domain-containing protein [Calditrichota bacterium]